jgi:hypothetical protein
VRVGKGTRLGVRSEGDARELLGSGASHLPGREGGGRSTIHGCSLKQGLTETGKVIETERRSEKNSPAGTARAKWPKYLIISVVRGPICATHELLAGGGGRAGSVAGIPHDGRAANTSPLAGPNVGLHAMRGNPHSGRVPKAR